MKINRLDAHDRLEHFTSQSFDIAACCQDLIDKRPFGEHAFYIFAHARTDEDGVTKRLIWQPRLTKPRAQENSMLFKAYPGTDKLKICWMIPVKETWKQFQKDKLTENQLICWSIEEFKTNKKSLEAKEEDDLSDKQIDAIYKEISRAARQANEAASSSSKVLLP
jgi:hypothetical protein